MPTAKFLFANKGLIYLVVAEPLSASIVHLKLLLFIAFLDTQLMCLQKPLYRLSHKSPADYIFLLPGFQVQDALCVRPFPHQRGHPGGRGAGRD